MSRMNQQAIGYLDSGFGGLSVVREVMKILPHESVVYFGDTARCPYGSRTAEEIEQFGREGVSFLLSQNIKALVIACNTVSSTHFFQKLKKQLSIPVIGVIESGSRVALEATKTGMIAICGTEQTIRSRAHEQCLKRLNDQLTVHGQACPDWVELVEKNETTSQEVREKVSDQLHKLEDFNYDTLILGCTHFPFLMPVIREVLSDTVTLIDPSVETAQELKQVLEKQGLQAQQTKNPNHVFYTSGDPRPFQEFLGKWLGNQYSTEHISLPQLAESAQTILIATHNQGKAREYRQLFQKMGYSVRTLHDYPEIGEIPENGETFTENALIKAQTLSELTNQMVIADDSGLMVKALAGKPGIHSGRYSGEPKDDYRNNQKLLFKMENISESEREAKFHTTIVAVAPNKEPLIVSGEVRGYIVREARGDNGFGYDPLFYLPDYEQTMAEMSAEEKNAVSHRARAFQELEKKFDDWLNGEGVISDR